MAGHLEGAGGHDAVLHQVLDLLHAHGMAAALAGFLDLVGDGQDLGLGQALALVPHCGWPW